MAGKVGQFFSSAGRVGPLRAVLVTALMLLAAWLAREALSRGDTIVYAPTGALFGAVLAKSFAEWARRLHDIGRSGYLGAGVMAALAVVVTAVGVSDLGFQAPGLYDALIVLSGLIAAALLLWPGEKEPNAYGDPPTGLARTRGPTPIGRRGVAWAAMSILGCLLIGSVFRSISDGMRLEREDRMRDLQQRDGVIRNEAGSGRTLHAAVQLASAPAGYA